MPQIICDLNEPLPLCDLIGQALEVERGPLNHNGMADYFWSNLLHKSEQVERKQADEVMGSISDVEEQLRREYVNADVTRLVIEGCIAPAGTGLATYKLAKDGKVMYRSRVWRHSYQGFQQWLSRLDQLGITVHWTSDWGGTARLLVGLYLNSQKEDMTTFSRYIKPKVYIAQYNPYVLTLMGTENGAMGEENARAAIAKFKTPFNVYNASQWDVGSSPLVRDEDDKRRHGTIGQANAAKFHRAIGRA